MPILSNSKEIVTQEASLGAALAKSGRAFVAVIGSGLSAQAELPTWPALATRLLADAQLKLTGNGQGMSLNDRVLARQISDGHLWRAMDTIRASLGADWEVCVQKQLRYECPPNPPDSLLSLLSLPIAGVISFNLDRLAEAAYATMIPTVPPNAGTSRDLQFMRSGWTDQRFIFYPHGVLNRPDTWCLTKRDLDNLQGDAGYKEYWRRVLDLHTLLLVGIDPSDVAVLPNLICK